MFFQFSFCFEKFDDAKMNLLEIIIRYLLIYSRIKVFINVCTRINNVYLSS